MSDFSWNNKVVIRARMGDPVKYDGVPSPPCELEIAREKKLNENVMTGSWNDEDPSVCLNCTRKKCCGEKACYLKRKKEKEYGNT